MDPDEDGQPFAVPDWWKPSSLVLEGLPNEPTLFGAVDFDVSSIKIDNPYATSKPLSEHTLHLPDIESFAFGPLPDLEPIDESEPSLDFDHAATDGQQEEDIWRVALKLGPLENDVKYYTWESFLNAAYKEPCSAYISEAGAEALDAALEAQAKEKGSRVHAGNVAQASVILNSLMALGLGLESVLFTWDHKYKTFMEVVHDGRMSGYSLSSMQSLVKRFIRIGDMTRHLQSSVEKTYGMSSASPAKLALAGAVRTILDAIESNLLPRITSVQSIVQLQHLFERPQRILEHITSIMGSVKTARNDVDLVSILSNQLQDYEQEDDMLRSIVLHVVARASGHSLELIGDWTGLRSERDIKIEWPTALNTFVDCISKSTDQDSKGMDEYSYRWEGMPGFIAPQDGHLVFEIGKSLRILKHHHPEHPLSEPVRFKVTPPGMQWKFGWEDVDGVVVKANAYQEAVTAAVLEYTRHGFDSENTHGETSEVAEAVSEPLNNTGDLGKDIMESMTLLDAPPKGLDALPDELRETILSHLSDDTALTASTNFAPPVSLTPLISFNPLLTTQARLVNASILRLLFRSHDLRTHLSLQYAFQLLGDGVFISRLTSSLFDPELGTAERQRGTLRLSTTMGLRLGGRKTWPPASSELRLALMGILSETWTSSPFAHKKDQIKDIGTKRDNMALPGDLSFAIRQLSPSDIDRCMDPHSLYALDFLRLQYTASSPLHTILTPEVLEKYDTIFKFLLRLTRMSFVISHLSRNLPDAMGRKMRNEAHHFVSSCYIYFFDALRESWADFSRWLDTLEYGLAQEDAAGELGKRVNEGIESVRAKHEALLDDIIFKLLLRGRQRQVMGLLEELFGLVLRFANSKEDEDVKEIYRSFSDKVRVFVSVCRGLVGKKGYVKKSARGEELNTIERLLVAIEMSGYYGDRPKDDV